MSPRGDEIVPLSRIRSQLARPRGYKQVDALISSSDAAAAVAALGVGELYQLVKEVGFADSVQLIGLATPEQVRGCIDLDAWDRDRLQVDALAPWLSALIESGFENLGRVWDTLDAELAALTIARSCFIYDLSLGEEVPDHEDRPLYNTPDTFFTLALNAEDEASQVLLLRLVDDLYKADMVLARHTLMSARSEPVAELEEMSFRWRSGRLADLGYIDFYDALEIFRPLDARSVTVGEGTEDHFGAAVDGDNAQTPGELPAQLAEGLLGRAFLARALDAIADPEHIRRLESAFIVLVNKVLSALRISPGNDEGLRVGGDFALSGVALGLEIVSQGEVDRAAQALRTISLTRLHRVGYTATLRLSRLATVLAARSATAGEPAGALIAALTAARPLFPGELDSPPSDEPRPFESTEDIRIAADALTRLALRMAVADALGVNLEASIEASTLEHTPEMDDYIRTALVRGLIGDALEPAPLTADELSRVRAEGFDGSRSSAAARTLASEGLIAILDKHNIDSANAVGRAGHHGALLPSLLTEWFADIDSLFGELNDGTPPDPRFLAGILTSADCS